MNSPHESMVRQEVPVADKTPLAQVKRKTAKAKAGKSFLPYLMISPSLIIFLIFSVIPLFYMIVISFYKWNMISKMKFINVKNYLTMFKSKDFWNALWNTIRYMGMMVPTTIILALLLAVYLKRNTRINKFIQTVMFMPNVVSLVSVSFIWLWIMNERTGLLNFVLSWFGHGAVNWLGAKETAMLSLVIVSVWKSLGYFVLILVAALQSVPKYLYEAAALDKASRLQVFFKITLPMISPTLFYLTLVGLIGSFKVFESVQLMTGGGPVNSTTTLVHEIYLEGFVFYKTGYSAAMSVVLMILVGTLTFIYFTVLQRRVHYQ